MTSSADHGDQAPDTDTNAPDTNAPDAGSSDARGIEPDEKDWTWVLKQPCPECGLDAASVPGPEVAGRLRQNAARWPAVCDRADVRVRPEPLVWSALEYACHVRDVCRVFQSRVSLLLSEVDPVFESWDQDAAAVDDLYGVQNPEVVGVELWAAAEAAAASFDAVGDRDWQRVGRRADGSVFTVETLGQYFLHDLTHHLHDVRG